MEFDCRKVYGAENADAIKKGDKVYAADDFAILKDLVNNEGNPDTIKCIRNTANFRFQTEDNNYYAFAYLVERAAEKWRPFKDIDELTDAWIRFTGIPQVANTMPLIWVRNKKSKCIGSISNFGVIDVFVFGCWKYMSDLFDDYEFLDGTPCGVKE